jgi:hypothetical protein
MKDFNVEKHPLVKELSKLYCTNQDEFASYVLQRSEISLKPRTKKEARMFLDDMETNGDYENSAWES